MSRFSASLCYCVTIAWLVACVPARVSAQPALPPAPTPTTVPAAADLVFIPYRQQPIDYFSNKSADAVALLGPLIEAGEVALPFQAEQGYLLGLLAALKISVDSQTLVYSKSSANVRLIGPKTPRAIYFNDEVYVAWIPTAATLEITAIDPEKGGLFYTLPQQPERLKFKREESCLLCHVSQHSLRVPGHLVRSFTTDSEGNLRSGYSRVTDETQLDRRWGGWYVTGTHGSQPHLGNLVSEADVEQHQRDPSFGGNVTDLKPFFDVGKYASPHSDIVAHLVLEHHLHLQNLLTGLNDEVRSGRGTAREPAVLRYLLYADAAEWPETIAGTSQYTEWFQAQGPRDGQGRSLRQLDLRTRLPKYRLSHLIYSRAFNALPADSKNRLYRQLWEYLHGKETSGTLPAIPLEEANAIREILLETNTDLPEYWRKP